MNVCNVFNVRCTYILRFFFFFLLLEGTINGAVLLHFERGLTIEMDIVKL